MINYRKDEKIPKLGQKKHVANNQLLPEVSRLVNKKYYN
jgi:hypothetical protein